MFLELVSVIVEEYDPAIDFFVNVLGFELVEDSPSMTNAGASKRWVVVRPPGAVTGVLLARADGPIQEAAVGNQMAGRVGLFLRVDDFDAAYQRMVGAGVEFVSAPRTEPYGQVAVFRDIAGNRWDLLGPRPEPSPTDGEPTAWFERLYVAADEGTAIVPWDRAEPGRLLVEWANQRRLDGTGKTALVVGCGYGRDAEFMASIGYDTTAFDVSPTAIAGARRRHPGSPVRYLSADVLTPPADWTGRFDLVVEDMNVQALPDPIRRDAIESISGLVGAGGTLIVIAVGDAGEASGDTDGPPWPLSRAEIGSFATAGLVPVDITDITDQSSGIHRWRAEFHRPA